MIIKMPTKLGRIMNEHSKNFNKAIENIRKYQTEGIELKNTVTEPKNTLEAFHSRFFFWSS